MPSTLASPGRWGEPGSRRWGAHLHLQGRGAVLSVDKQKQSVWDEQISTDIFPMFREWGVNEDPELDWEVSNNHLVLHFYYWFKCYTKWAECVTLWKSSSFKALRSSEPVQQARWVPSCALLFFNVNKPVSPGVFFALSVFYNPPLSEKWSTTLFSRTSLRTKNSTKQCSVRASYYWEPARPNYNNANLQSSSCWKA